jgi:protease-4
VSALPPPPPVAPAPDLSEARHLVERRRLRRRVGLWRLIAVAALAVAGAVGAWRLAPQEPYVARHAVAGVIFDDPVRDDFLRGLADDDRVLALVLRIDSPGGSVAGSEALYEAVRAVAAAKPVVAVMGEVAASGGYIAALAADRIVARGGTVTGSIGVVAEYPNVAGLLENIGVGVARVASAPLKAEPSPFREPSPEALAAQAEVVADAYRWFLALVAERRGLPADRARGLGDGRVYTGRQAVETGLIDAIGGEEAALDWLTQVRGVPAGARVRDVDPDDESAGFDRLLDGSAVRDALAGWTAAPRPMAILR